MNGRLSKVDMTDKLLKLKRELDYKCEIGEMGEWECVWVLKNILIERLMYQTSSGNERLTN